MIKRRDTLALAAVPITLPALARAQTTPDIPIRQYVVVQPMHWQRQQPPMP